MKYECTFCKILCNVAKGSNCPRCGYKSGMKEVKKVDIVKGPDIVIIEPIVEACVNCKIRWEKSKSVKCPHCGLVPVAEKLELVGVK